MSQVKYANLAEMMTTHYRTTVLYARPGRRKTTTACDMVLNRGIYVSADNSWIVLKKSIHKELADKVAFVHYEGIMDTLEKLDLSGKTYDTLILDTYTAMVDRYLDLLFDKASWGGRYRETLVTQERELKGMSTTAPIDYKVTRDRFRPIVDLFKQSPMHVIYLMHVNHPIKGLSKDLTFRPRLPEATWGNVAEVSNIIGYIEGADKNGFTVELRESSSLCEAKSQIEGIEGKMSLDRFIQRYRETLQ